MISKGDAAMHFLFRKNIDYHLSVILEACEELARSTSPIVEGSETNSRTDGPPRATEPFTFPKEV